VTERPRVQTLRDMYRAREDPEPVVSIEVFPPRSVDGDEALFETLDRLIPYRPAFVSCTYGAAGSTRMRTVELCGEIQSRYGCAATAHLTCVGSRREELVETIEQVKRSGLRNIMALRGDPPAGDTRFQAADGGLEHADELVELIRTVTPEMGVGVAAYPEVHPEAVDAASDLEYLKRKVLTGADASFTQLFYVNENFLRFREEYDRVGVGVPLVPGIMPITEFSRIRRIATLCGAVFPDELARRLEEVKDDRAAQFSVGIDHAIGQCRQLIDEGVPGLHFYALNRSQACGEILEALGRGAPPAACHE